ncbi:cysteine hydrolase family protein [Methylovirgula sp. 4M-Z18]|uniref:cysteine hydrolase family protein n=1 Tax=Methylovirgula sp. 4M-Z18 TaxID=2293567 RepID=UPI000E2FEAF1|nr:cysteine hydrolase family protein [Methylovirgula sp. 4M-Z18]RFB79306.1 cysteine hydrolase [Methylovirgula sp. 4M-Z18]
MRLPSTTPLLIVDVQNAIDDPKWGPRNNPQAEGHLAWLIEAWRRAALPVIHIRHDSTENASPYRPGQPGHAFKPEVAPHPGERVIGKEANSAFVGTDLEALLEDDGVTHLVIAGVLTQNSVEATVRHAGNLGFQVYLVADACWACDVTDLSGRIWPAEDVHALSLAHLHKEYAEIVDTATAGQAALITAIMRARRNATRAG